MTDYDAPLNAMCARCGELIFLGEQHTPMPDGTYTYGPFMGCTFKNACAVNLKAESDA
jgi:hypothetical protein